MDKIILDNSGRSTFRSCKKKYFLQIVNGWQSNTGSTALRYGSCWHAIQEGYHSWIRDNGWPTNSSAQMEALTQGLTLGKQTYDNETAKKEFFDDYKNYNTAVEGFAQYLEYFKDDSKYLEIISTEKKFECPITADNKTEQELLDKLSIPLHFTGKIDLAVKMDYVKWIFDFKTTGWYLDSVIAQANRSPQLIGYSYAGRKVLDFEPQGCLCSFASANSSKSRVTGEYGKVRFDFRRVPQIYTEGDIKAWKLSFIDTAIDIKSCHDSGIWAESFDNCYQYGPCKYLRLCQQHVPYEELNFDGFHVDHWNVLEE